MMGTSVIWVSPLLNSVILHPGSGNYTKFFIVFSLQQMHHALSTSQAIHSSHVTFVIHFTFVCRTAFCIAQETALKIESIVSLIWFLHSKEKVALAVHHCYRVLTTENTHNPFLLSHGEWPNIIISSSPFQALLLKLHLMNLLTKEEQLQGFCYQNFPITAIIPHWAVMLKICTSICIYIRMTYANVHTVYAIISKKFSFTAVTSLDCHLCRLRKHFSLLFLFLLFIPGANASSLHRVAGSLSFPADVAISLLCLSGYPCSQGQPPRRVHPPEISARPAWGWQPRSPLLQEHCKFSSLLVMHPNEIFSLGSLGNQILPSH